MWNYISQRILSKSCSKQPFSHFYLTVYRIPLPMRRLRFLSRVGKIPQNEKLGHPKSGTQQRLNNNRFFHTTCPDHHVIWLLPTLHAWNSTFRGRKTEWLTRFLKSDNPWYESWLCQLFPIQPWTNYWTSFILLIKKANNKLPDRFAVIIKTSENCIKCLRTVTDTEYSHQIHTALVTPLWEQRSLAADFQLKSSPHSTACLAYYRIKVVTRTKGKKVRHNKPFFKEITEHSLLICEKKKKIE